MLAVVPATGAAQVDEVAHTPVDTAAIGAMLSIEHVEGIDPWVVASAHRTFVPRWGVAVARVTAGQRFGRTGVQGEVEAYPRVGRVGYIYAAAAFTPHKEVFVPLRAALELFSSPRPAIEVSGGARFFHASSRTIVAYTGSIGGYRGNYWYAFRPFVVPDTGGVSITGQASLRRYWAGRYDYVGMHLTATRGTDPTARDPMRFGRDNNLTTFTARIERLRPIRSGRARFGYALGVDSEEIAESRRRLHVILAFRLERLLR